MAQEIQICWKGADQAHAGHTVYSIESKDGEPLTLPITDDRLAALYQQSCGGVPRRFIVTKRELRSVKFSVPGGPPKDTMKRFEQLVQNELYTTA